MRRTFPIAVVLFTGALSLAATTALAHARLLTASPKAGQAVAASPKALELHFSEDIDIGQSSVTVTGPTGAAVPTGPIALGPKDKHLVVAPLTAPLAPGAYAVAWKMTSADMHRTEGKYVFTVKP